MHCAAKLSAQCNYSCDHCLTSVFVAQLLGDVLKAEATAKKQ